MSKTRILDATLDALRDKPGAKRAKREAQVTIDLYVKGGKGYTIQVNGKLMDAVWNATEAEGRAAAEKRVKAAKEKGLTVVLNVY